MSRIDGKIKLKKRGKYTRKAYKNKDTLDLITTIKHMEAIPTSVKKTLKKHVKNPYLLKDSKGVFFL